ncbi:MAG: SCO family protein [Sphingobacteriales bacterium]|nr:SCO family protein [Sphingobacteriales bacterium]
MKKQWLIYGVFFVVLLAVFYCFLFREVDFSQSGLPVINANLQPFSFVNQNGKTITEKNIEGKVYVAEYFFTTCKGICPKMNANMRRVFETYKNEPDFMIISHTCMPETDSVPLLKAYEYKMLTGKLAQNIDGSYKIEDAGNTNATVQNTNWNFVTGDKTSLYDLARHSYLIDNNKSDTLQNMADQFIHTQLFALVDKQHRVRGIYDGLKEQEIEKLLTDVKHLLEEKAIQPRLMNTNSNTPN